MNRCFKFLSLTALTIALTFPVHLVIAAESEKYEPGSTPWGNPDLQGIWDYRTLTPFERPPALKDKAMLTEEEAYVFREQTVKVLDVDNRDNESTVDVEGAYNTFWWDWGTELDKDLRTSLIVDPPDGRLPNITPEAQARKVEQNLYRRPPVRDLFSYSAVPATFRPDGPESLGLSERCLVGLNSGPPMTPGAYNNNVRIIQTPEYVVLFTEMIHDARVVRMDGRPHLPKEMRKWSGDSRGHWEGKTLVVETTNFTDNTPAFQLPATLENAVEAGAVGTGLNLHLVERFTRVGENRLIYEYTVNDPTTFTKPFTVMIPMRSSEGRMFEYACHEGNYAVQGMLKGARLLDAEAD